MFNFFGFDGRLSHRSTESAELIPLLFRLVRFTQNKWPLIRWTKFSGLAFFVHWDIFQRKSLLSIKILLQSLSLTKFLPSLVQSICLVFIQKAAWMHLLFLMIYLNDHNQIQQINLMDIFLWKSWPSLVLAQEDPVGSICKNLIPKFAFHFILKQLTGFLNSLGPNWRSS